MARIGDSFDGLTKHEAEINYLVHGGEKLVTYIDMPGKKNRERNAVYKKRPASIHDGRPRAAEFTLDREGFALKPHPTRVTDFFDEAEVKAVYGPELEELVKAATGARRVVVFDTQVRTGDDALRAATGTKQPSDRAHNDYTERSGPQRVRDLLPDEADELLKRRFAIVNVWRAIRRPIESMPLALCDARSIRLEQLITTERHAPDRIGETQHLTYSPDHKWVYFPHMVRDEALLIKCYDSARDGRARFTAHSGFVDPASPPDASPRESIEARTFAFF